MSGRPRHCRKSTILGHVRPHCAPAKIQRTSHSGQLGDVPITPGKLHLDFRGPLANSINGEKYACIAVDEYSRYVFVRFAKTYFASRVQNLGRHPREVVQHRRSGRLLLRRRGVLASVAHGRQPQLAAPRQRKRRRDEEA